MKVYLCDPKKNTECKKTMCYKINCDNPCRHTTNKKYRANLLKRIFSKAREFELPEDVVNADTK